MLKQPGKVTAVLAAVITVSTVLLKSLLRSGVEVPDGVLTGAVVVLAIVALVYLVYVFREGKSHGKKQ